MAIASSECCLGAPAGAGPVLGLAAHLHPHELTASSGQQGLGHAGGQAPLIETGCGHAGYHHRGGPLGLTAPIWAATHWLLSLLQHTREQHLLLPMLRPRTIGQEAHAEQPFQVLFQAHQLASSGLAWRAVAGQQALEAALAGARLPAAKTAGPACRLRARPWQQDTAQTHHQGQQTLARATLIQGLQYPESATQLPWQLIPLLAVRPQCWHSTGSGGGAAALEGGHGLAPTVAPPDPIGVGGLDGSPILAALRLA